MGPMGMGPMTGRGMGYCAGYAVPGYANFGFGWGRGRGFRRMYHLTGLPGWARYGVPPYGVPPYGAYPYGYEGAPVEEKKILQKEVAFLEKELNELRERLKELEAE